MFARIAVFIARRRSEERPGEHANARGFDLRVCGVFEKTPAAPEPRVGGVEFSGGIQPQPKGLHLRKIVRRAFLYF